jgi:hypothetical protein
MKRLALAARCPPALAALLLGGGVAGASSAQLDGRLVAAVFDGDPAIYAPPPADLSADAIACRNAYLRALPRPLDRDAGETMRQPKRLLAARRDFVARQAQALAGGRGGQDARRFAQGLTLHVEWEGMSEPPLTEAHEALRWVGENPASPVVPAALLFAAHRQRAAYECAVHGGEAGAAASAAAGWRDAIRRARGARVPLIDCLAADLDRVGHVYLTGAGHPDHADAVP